MSMIPCSEDCVYQREGYCSLDVPPLVTNSDFRGCVHKISVEKTSAHPIPRNRYEDIRKSPPQMPL